MEYFTPTPQPVKEDRVRPGLDVVEAAVVGERSQGVEKTDFSKDGGPEGVGSPRL